MVYSVESAQEGEELNEENGERYIQDISVEMYKMCQGEKEEQENSRR